MKEKFLIAVLVAVFLGSCTIEKRRYLSGYHVQKKTSVTGFNKTKNKSIDCDQPSSTVNYSVQKIEGDITDNEGSSNIGNVNKIETLSTIINENKFKKNITKLSHPRFPKLGLKSLEIIKPALPADSCDIIVMRNGEEIEAKVQEIGLNEVKYKRCDNLNGPTKVIEKNSVFMIKYPNGTKDVFSKEEVSAEMDNRTTEQTRREADDSGTGFALVALGWTFVIISVLIFWFVSMLFGAILGVLGAVFLIIGTSKGD